MTKTNFTKVEDALNEGLLRMNIAGLHDAAAAASHNEATEVPANPVAMRKQVIAAVQFELKHCKDDQLFVAGGVNRADLKKMLQRIDDLAPEKWARLEAFREKTVAYKKNKLEKLPADANEKLIEAQKKKHINKRYNTKEQWLPLH